MKKSVILAVAALAGILMAGAVSSQEAAPTQPQQVLRLHTVKAGENLCLLAGYYYGDARQWKKIWELNKKEIRNPNRINVGQVIKVELEPGWQAKFDLDKFIADTAGKTAGIKVPSAKKPTLERSYEEVKSTVVPRLLEEPAKEELKPGEKPETPPPATEEKPK